MAFIGLSRKSQDTPWYPYVCLDKEDCRVLSQIIGSLVARKLRSFEYYDGIHEGGEATEKQVDKYFKAQTELETAREIESGIMEFLKS
jgi:hypothetical protein